MVQNAGDDFVFPTVLLGSALSNTENPVLGGALPIEVFVIVFNMVLAMPSSSADPAISGPTGERWRRNFLADLHDNGVKRARIFWYRRWVEQLLRQYQLVHSMALEAADIAGCLVALGSAPYHSWQLVDCR